MRGADGVNYLVRAVEIDGEEWGMRGHRSDSEEGRRHTPPPTHLLPRAAGQLTHKGTAFLATADARQWHMPRLTIFCHTGPPSQNSWANTWRCHFTLGTPISKSSQPSWTAPSAPTCAWSSGRRRSSKFYDYYGLGAKQFMSPLLERRDLRTCARGGGAAHIGVRAGF